MIDERLVRWELPIQCIYQRNQAVTTTVPIHLAVMALPKKTRTDSTLIAGARDTVKPWYDEDMRYYLDVLRKAGTELPWLGGYERFRDKWQIWGESDKHGFLSLLWRENGETHNMRFNPIPVIFSNQHDEFREFYTPESWRRKDCVEIIYRNVCAPEVVAMSPEKLRKYGRETDISKTDENRGIAEVLGNAFTSDYHMNMAKTLLLRDFAVFYLNRLLDRAHGNST